MSGEERCRRVGVSGSLKGRRSEERRHLLRSLFGEIFDPFPLEKIITFIWNGNCATKTLELVIISRHGFSCLFLGSNEKIKLYCLKV